MAAAYLKRVGERIRERRDELGLSQRELAEQLPGKADGNQVSKWERGLHRPSDDTLEHIAKILSVDVAYFLAATPEPGTGDLLAAFDGETQLDRIERKLDALIRMQSAGELERVLDEVASNKLPQASGSARASRSHKRAG